jgi:hypothetical protein
MLRLAGRRERERWPALHRLPAKTVGPIRGCDGRELWVAFGDAHVAGPFADVAVTDGDGKPVTDTRQIEDALTVVGLLSLQDRRHAPLFHKLGGNLEKLEQAVRSEDRLDGRQHGRCLDAIAAHQRLCDRHESLHRELLSEVPHVDTARAWLRLAAEHRACHARLVDLFSALQDDLPRRCNGFTRSTYIQLSMMRTTVRDMIHLRDQVDFMASQYALSAAR